MFWISSAHAMGAGQQAGQDPNLLASLMPFILIFVVFYFLLIRPQQKKAKEHRELLNSLKAGDAVVTAGGLYGRIAECRDDVVIVDLGDTKVTLGRGFITSVPDKAKAAAAPRPEKKSKKTKEAKDAAPEQAETIATPQVAAEAGPEPVVTGGQDADGQVVHNPDAKDDKA
jgi:preprotein translocase subunit YajC